MTRHFLRDDDLSASEQSLVLDLALELKRAPYSRRPLEGPQAVAVIFDKPSTRTRVSFSAGIAHLGGFPLVMDAEGSQLGRGEPIADTRRVLERQTAAIVWRTGEHERIEEMARAAQVPVINSLTDGFHPCQVLADALTIREEFGHLAGIRVAYVGDAANNMGNSYALGLTLAGMHVRFAAPSGYQPSPEIVQRAQQLAADSGGSFAVLTDAVAAVSEAEVVITDTWVSMGQEDEKAHRLQQFGGYQVNTDLLAHAADAVIVLHCLPAYRGYEISAEAIEGPASRVWQQAENRLHVQKALLVFLLEQK